MGQRLRETDWSRTALGPATDWPLQLRTLVALMLASNQPMYVMWGATRAFLYNDHYAPSLGAKHPAALAQPDMAVAAVVRRLTALANP